MSADSTFRTFASKGLTSLIKKALEYSSKADQRRSDKEKAVRESTQCMKGWGGGTLIKLRESPLICLVFRLWLLSYGVCKGLGRS